MANEKPCIYKHTCGFDVCMMSDCCCYEPKTKGKKWFEETAETDCDEKSMGDFLEENGLVIRICDGAITICDGDCEHCGEDEEDYEID